MPDTNFLNPVQANNQSARAKKLRKSVQSGLALGRKTIRKSAKSASPAKRGEQAGGLVGKKIDKPPFELSKNLDSNPAMPKAELKIKNDAPATEESEAGNIYPVKNNISNLVRKNGANGIYRKIAFSFVALTVILVLAVLYFGFSKVTLLIVPTKEKVTDSLTVEITDKASSTAQSQGQIVGIVRQVSMEQSRTFTSSGKEVLGEEVSGKVTLINDYMKNQPLVATTRLLGPNNKLFRLKNTVNIPAGGRVEAEVYADEAKADMAIGPSKFTIPGLWAGLQDKIYAESREAMKYNEKVKHIIKQSDIDNAVSELKNGLLANAKKEVGQAYKEFGQSILEVDNNSVTQEVQGKVGEEKETFTIKMKTKVMVVAFNDDDIYRQAEAKLNTALADDKEIMEFSRPDMNYNLGNSNLSQGTASVNVNFTARVALKDGANIIKKNNLAGLNVEQVKAYLNSLPDVAGYEIKFTPSFIKKMPSLVDRIEIVIQR